MLVAILTIVAALCAAIGFSHARSQQIEAEHPNAGERIDVGGYALNSLHIPKPPSPDLPPIVFIHGASGNLRDQYHAFAGPLGGRAEMLFVDRPGHGYSERGGPRNAFPDGQADAIATLMQKRGIDRAIIVGHSFGGAIAASFALSYPEKTAGLLLLAPATHPWPGGIDWYYSLASTPLLGRLFTRTLTLPLGLSRVDAGTHSVFHPNVRPDDYIERTGPALVLRPQTFVHNAVDIANLHGYVSRVSPRYSEITAPTIIITGDRDKVVAAEIHSRSLVQTIPGAELVIVSGAGHKPDYVATDVAIAALEKLAGKPGDLDEVVAIAEARIAAQGK
ncbi:alpha/beta hydrolase [Rhizobium sp. LjRoot30]|uniref:alpha/beta fold hydrolase n=1 Tax=Rhizobium sp. LjRoot30 TaxID=3342320 RepID=UPI003ED14E3F